MSRLVPHADMTAAEIVKCCAQAQALVRLCESAAWFEIQNEAGEQIAAAGENIQLALQLVSDLLIPVQEALEIRSALPEQQKERAA